MRVRWRYKSTAIPSISSQAQCLVKTHWFVHFKIGKLSRPLVTLGSWIAKYADSENENGNHTLDKVYDLQESTYWQTTKGAGFPHLIVIDLGSVQTVKALEYLPRAEQGAPGSVKDYKIFVY